LNAHGVNNVRQTEMHRAELFISEFSSFEVEIAIRKLKDISNQALIALW